VAHILQNVAADYDRQWRLRKRVIDTLMLMLLIFRLVCSKNTQSYGTTIDDLWDNCRKLNLALPQKSSIAPSSKRCWDVWVGRIATKYRLEHAIGYGQTQIRAMDYASS